MGVGVLVEGVLEARQLFVLVVGVDGDLFDQVVEFGIGLARWAHGFSLSGGGVGAVQDEWWAADLAVFEPADRAVHAHDGGVLVQLDDHALDAVQVAGAGVVIDPHAVSDREHRERFLRVDRAQQLMPGVYGFGDRDKMGVQLARGDLVKQQPFKLGRSAAGRRTLWRGQAGEWPVTVAAAGAVAHNPRVSS
jgi:hypothetical protein